MVGFSHHPLNDIRQFFLDGDTIDPEEGVGWHIIVTMDSSTNELHDLISLSLRTYLVSAGSE